MVDGKEVKFSADARSRLLKGVNIFEFNKPSTRKITLTIKDQILISFKLNIGQIP